ncbi:armadillo-type protein [Syncephalastrum racemosum]|uniref:Armadillo-type protein n=1 Tax=Syncephalastrum racemosum TaxID=13706 RepID=A0A1X2HG14_SYNRA|nr:armadillo-type protein [Syncephalastrum racemosum]
MTTPKSENRIKKLTEELKQRSNQDVSDLLLERARLLKELDRIPEARDDIQTLLKRYPKNKEAQQLAKLLLTDSHTTNQKQTSTAPPNAELQDYLTQIDTDVKRFIQTPKFIQILKACGNDANDQEARQTRATAYMVLTRLFNPPQDKQKDYPLPSIIQTCADAFSKCLGSGKNADKLLAYRTLHAIFETSMTVGAAILSQEGVVEDMMDVFEFEVLPVQIAMTEVLAIASSDKSCQKRIVEHGSQWLAKAAAGKEGDERLKAAAGTALMKLRMQQQFEQKQGEEGQEQQLQSAMELMHLNTQELTDNLARTIKSKSTPAVTVLSAVEGLAYASLQPDVKETIAHDPALLKRLVTLALESGTAHAQANPLLFGIGTILTNVTLYKPVLDEQQRQIRKLRNLANAKKNGTVEPEEDPREQDAAVEARIRAVIDQGGALALMVLSKNNSQNLKSVAARAYLNLVTPKKTRGKLLQQGIVKGLAPLASDLQAAHALARLAITTDPRLAFGGQTSLALVRPFLNLCKDNAQLRQFEGLMALTNLASVDDDSVRLKIVAEDGMTTFENLQLSNHTMVQRAATEMICNMVFCDPVFETYSTHPGKLRLMMILSDHEDMATRRAASGCLAILANRPEACQHMAQVDKGYERIARLLQPEESIEVQHRGIEVIRCMLQHLGKPAAQGLSEQNAQKHLAHLVKSKVAAVRSAASEVLKMMMAELGVQIK